MAKMAGDRKITLGKMSQSDLASMARKIALFAPRPMFLNWVESQIKGDVVCPFGNWIEWQNFITEGGLEKLPWDK